MSSEIQNKLVFDAARNYLDQGWSVFPVSPPDEKLTAAHRELSGKFPSSIRYYIHSIRNKNRLRRRYFHDYGVGIATGKISGLVVLDVDLKDNGLENISKFNLPNTRTVKSGTGLHLYFQHPGEQYFVPSSPNTLASGIDIKGENGFVSAPPTLHPNSSYYEWLDSTIPIADLPKELLEVIMTLPHRPRWKLCRRYLYRKYIRHPFNALTGL